MTAMEFIDHLVGLARKAPPPATDVRDKVLARLRRTREMSLTPLWVYVGWLAPVAVAATVFGMRIWFSLSSWLSSVYWADVLDDCLVSLKGITP
jgi:hypothetical protein